MARNPNTVWAPVTGWHREPAIVPTQVIVHSIVGSFASAEAWFNQSVYESHFGVRKDGYCEQWQDTELQADANYKANVRAISIETEDNGHPDSDPWTDRQLDRLVEVIDWACTVHEIPRHLAPAWDAPGLGWHVMYPQHWTNVPSKTCPGRVRVEQFNDIVLPRVQAKEEDMPSAQEVAEAVWAFRNQYDIDASLPTKDGQIRQTRLAVEELSKAVKALAKGTPQQEEVEAIAERVKQKLHEALGS